MTSAELLSSLNSASGFLLLLAILIWLTRNRNSDYFAVLIGFSAYLSAIGSYKIIDTLGTHILGGSLYLPFTILVMAVLCERFPYVKTRMVLSSLVVGLGFFIIGNVRWMIFEGLNRAISPTHTDSVGRLEYMLTALMLLYTAGLCILVFQRFKGMSPFKRVMLPACLAIVSVTTIQILATARHHGVYYEEYGFWQVVISTYAVRVVLPALFASYLLTHRHWLKKVTR